MRGIVSAVVISLVVVATNWIGSANVPREEQIAGESAAAVVDESSGLWFVELASPPTADGTPLTTVRREKAAFRRAAAAAGLVYQERFAFDTLWNGLSVRISADQVGALRRLSGVTDVYPVETIPVPNPQEDTFDPQLVTALVTTGASAAQAAGFTGAGVKVAIMDTGIDYDHPDLGGCFGPGCRVETGWDFVGDEFTGGNTPVPDTDPDDCNGHGTHVAGIVGGAGAVTGVAPGVTFGAYRVFGCDGSTTQDIMIAAMERALADGMQVLNMSIGSASQWPQRANAQASSRLVNKGVVVVASAGNDAAVGLYGSAAPSVGDKVISVASFQNTHSNQVAFAVSPDGQLIGYNAASGGSVPPPVTGALELARTGTTASTADACAALPSGSLTGKAALIRRGTCSFYIKSINARNAGAAAVVLYNNTTGTVSPSVTPTTAADPIVDIPVVAITQAAGALIDARIQAGATTLTWTDQTISTPSSNANQIAASSSWGVSPDLALKPDIGAPGGGILSTYPIEAGSYRTLSGTSMSSPHVAGAAALLLEARPRTSPQVVRSVLQNSAEPLINPSLGELYPTHRQGAGMLRIDAAIFAATKIDPGKLSLGESEGGPATRTLTIENKGADAVTYVLSHAGALATGPNTFTVTQLPEFAQVSFSAPTVTVPGGGTATVDVTIAPPAGLAERSLYSGYVVFTPEGGGNVLRVPFAGFKGDYQSIVALTLPTEIRRRTGTASDGTGIYSPSPVGDVFTLDGAFNVPYVYVHLEHQVRRLRLEVFDAVTGKPWHRARDLEYVGHNSRATTYSAYGWDGVTVAGNMVYTVPNGQYVIRLSALKALGDADNPAHWETWVSPPVTIQRP